MRSHHAIPTTLRRSFAIPGVLVEEARAVSPPEIRDNLNRLVTTALREFVARRHEGDFERAMARMAADPAIRRASGEITREFRPSDADGL